MNCFVIMPFAPDFDDVYTTIKNSVEGTLGSQQVKCFRLDESQPVGRITDRLLQEIQAASLCVADTTGSKPNVMWETGYAMALGKPTIIVTQDEGALPFDIQDMLKITYNRGQLSGTLSPLLRRAVFDTVNRQGSSPALDPRAPAGNQDVLVGQLLEQVRDLKSMLSEAVKSWNPPAPQAPNEGDEKSGLRSWEGAWLNVESRSHLYARLMENELVVPYCYGGNDHLTGAYFGWKKAGEFWFARFRWFTDRISGFAFLKQESFDVVTGAWWHDDEVERVPEVPILGSGVPARLERLKDAQLPEWAQRFFAEVQREGLVNRLTRRGP